ncbi:hypothetical protein GBN26_00005 [Plesiomonas shigelloides]|uniref:hypothetical protein n=1 Tax=Plesiomonas shigelloides TaxID=703 RepID=UPI001261C045|nr:hypothetical protein [Plesiomonas shigelloides]KAB7704045.1 hypothetical protein GBN26_00005 [Plesiomonas shigelloides]
MGFFSSVWDAVKTVGSTVARVVKKVYEVCTSDSAVDAYDKLEKIVNRQNTYQTPPSDGAPNFYGETNTSQIEKKISQQNQLIVKNEAALVESKKIISLQVELVRLRASADLIDRSMKNVKIHASSLSVHYQNMRNINGLIDDVNSLRHGLKAVISTINYNANIQSGTDSKLRRIEGLDVEKTEGAISQVAAYDAFDRTRELLRSEVIDLSEVASKHLNDINNLKANAADLGGALGAQIIEFVDKQIIPIIKKAESAGLLLNSEVSKLPAAVRKENGSLVFENGSIKLEQIE